MVESAAHVEHVFAADELFFSTTDSHGRIRRANSTFMRLSGYPRGALVGRAHNVVRHADMPAGLFRSIWDAIEEGRAASAYITNRQIEAARIAMTRHIKRGGKVWINIFPDRPLTKKPAETRMGSGKGAPEWWVAPVKPGRVMFELAGVPEELAREALSRAQHKLPIKTRFVVREGGDI